MAESIQCRGCGTARVQFLGGSWGCCLPLCGFCLHLPFQVDVCGEVVGTTREHRLATITNPRSGICRSSSSSSWRCTNDHTNVNDSIGALQAPTDGRRLGGEASQVPSSLVFPGNRVRVHKVATNLHDINHRQDHAQNPITELIPENVQTNNRQREGDCRGF